MEKENELVQETFFMYNGKRHILFGRGKIAEIIFMNYFYFD